MSKKNKKNHDRDLNRKPIKFGMDFGRGAETVVYTVDTSNMSDGEHPKVMQFKGCPQTVREMIRRNIAEKRLRLAHDEILRLHDKLKCEKVESDRRLNRISEVKMALKDEIEKVSSIRKEVINLKLKIIDFKCGYLPGAFFAGVVACVIVQAIYNYFHK